MWWRTSRGRVSSSDSGGGEEGGEYKEYELILQSSIRERGCLMTLIVESSTLIESSTLMSDVIVRLMISH